MTEWIPAKSMAELAPLFAPVPPEIGVPAQPRIPDTEPGYAGTTSGNQVSEQKGSWYQYSDDTRNLPCPPTYLWLAILSLLCCCVPLGIVSIIYATKVESTYIKGNYALAKEKSDKAKLWGILAVVLGFIAQLIYFIFMGAELFSTLQNVGY